MLNMFEVSHSTDGETVCKILVEPAVKRCGLTVSVAHRIVRIADESEPSLRSVTGAEWPSISFWETKAADIARAYSPFWKGESPK